MVCLTHYNDTKTPLNPLKHQLHARIQTSAIGGIIQVYQPKPVNTADDVSAHTWPDVIAGKWK